MQGLVRFFILGVILLLLCSAIYELQQLRACCEAMSGALEAMSGAL